MKNIHETVKQVIQSFVDQDVSFTALDVSNKVREQIPHSKHREVRQEVRNWFAKEHHPDWQRSVINVELEDGSSKEAFLYHPLSNSWDENTHYATANSPVSVSGENATLPAKDVLMVLTDKIDDLRYGYWHHDDRWYDAAPNNSSNHPTPSARNIWNDMFRSQSPLFPAK